MKKKTSEIFDNFFDQMTEFGAPIFAFLLFFVEFLILSQSILIVLIKLTFSFLQSFIWFNCKDLL